MAVISIAPYLTDKDEHTALYKINNKKISLGSGMSQAVYQVCASVFVFKTEERGKYLCVCVGKHVHFLIPLITKKKVLLQSRILLTFFSFSLSRLL